MLDPDGTPCDGPGNPSHDVGVTGLALLAFLADGQTPIQGRHAARVRRGVTWPVRQQTGNGRIGTDASNEFMYFHLSATLALLEAYGLSGDAALRPAAEKAIAYVEHHRNPGAAWRYQPRDNENDVSVTAWALTALVTAQDFGIVVDSEALRLGELYIDSMTDPGTCRTGYSERGGWSSRRAGEHSKQFPREMNEVLTAAAVAVEILLGGDPVSRENLSGQIRLVMGKKPRWSVQDGAIDLYAWYWGATAMRQAGEEHWQAWAKALHGALLPNQRDDGNFAGSWDPIDVWGEDGGRICTTALAVLSLSAPHRYAEVGKLKPLPDAMRFRAANDAWADRRRDVFDQALTRLEAQEGLEPIEIAALSRAREALVRETARAVAGVERWQKAEDLVAARDALKTITEEFGALEPGRLAADHLLRMQKSKLIKAELDVQLQLAAIRKRFDLSRDSERRKLRDALEKFIAAHPGTQAAEMARAAMVGLPR
ncbi:MAG: hypothetical protein HZB39_10670 [Planctomycetes bacterium]|nr:hypothetical protein [Planctomycetota bacterium]